MDVRRESPRFIWVEDQLRSSIAERVPQKGHSLPFYELPLLIMERFTSQCTSSMLPALLGKLSVPIIGGLSLIIFLYTTGKDIYDRVIKPFDLNVAKYVHEPNYKLRIGFLDEFEEDFGKVIEAITENGKWPLVVFIDDLDRCAPSKSVEVIEAINILLDSKYCVFIMGMDIQTVAGSIEAKYKDLQSSYADKTSEMTLGQSFLEKIVQINFHIPKANLVSITSFIEASLEIQREKPLANLPKKEVIETEQLIKAEQRTGKSLDSAAQVVQLENPHISVQTGNQAKQEIFTKTFDDSEEVLHAITKAAPYLGFNPRKIKRFINVFHLQAFIANRRGLIGTGEVRLDYLAKWMIIVTRWPSLVEAIIINEQFIRDLWSAYRAADNLNKSRMSDQRRNLSENAEFDLKIKEEEETRLQNTLEIYLENPYIKRFIDATDLYNLLDQLNESELEDLSPYLYLTQATT